MSALQLDYPHQPALGLTDTSATAGRHARRRLVAHDVIVALLRQEPRTADELASALGWETWNTRPRVSELRAMGEIVDSGVRRPARGGQGLNQIVWRVK